MNKKKTRYTIQEHLPGGVHKSSCFYPKTLGHPFKYFFKVFFEHQERCLWIRIILSPIL